MKILTIIAALGVIGAVLVVALFGTASPCGILREVTRQREKIPGIMPDVVVDTYLTNKHGSLTPAKCLGLLFSRHAPQSR
ncbi:hypothetical protein [Bradyrhizobium erythrophlei]|jgi:hypothetical protein|uniref:Uncharacterized protein n=1 Tax=Bradyrhizobium erythrophlei TaxID=1437360 RepID=A0A1M5S1I9_9BRAD|nr:hypothetical protein [Bradyrhizobium erythrophlei]SHH32492.1 hypothetical protein SAMN05444169_6897 [Bradyrhizobium erythrophlei]